MSNSKTPSEDDLLHRWMQFGGFAFMVGMAVVLAYRPLFDPTVTPKQSTLFCWVIGVALICAMGLLVTFLLTYSQVRKRMFVVVAVVLHRSGLLTHWIRRAETACQALQSAHAYYSDASSKTSHCDEQMEKNEWKKQRRKCGRYLPSFDVIKSQTFKEYVKVPMPTIYDEMLDERLQYYEDVPMFRYDRTALREVKRAIQSAAEDHAFLTEMRDAATRRQ
ncbi:MAG: hypothetical protein U0996_05280 [Planctomycetaceae bacterium]